MEGASLSNDIWEYKVTNCIFKRTASKVGMNFQALDELNLILGFQERARDVP